MISTACPLVTHVDFGFTEPSAHPSEAELLSLVELLPYLSSISFDLWNITAGGAGRIVQKLGNRLSDLHVASMCFGDYGFDRYYAGGGFLQCLAEHCPNLRRLSIFFPSTDDFYEEWGSSSLGEMVGVGLQAILQSCRRLECLDIQGPQQIPLDVFRVIHEKLGADVLSLRRLRLQGNWQLPLNEPGAAEVVLQLRQRGVLWVSPWKPWFVIRK